MKTNLEAAIELYHRLKKEQPRKYIFSERLLNQLGYRLLTKKMFEKAIGIFKLTVSEYPKSWNAYDSLVEAYLTKGERAHSLKYYKKATETNPNQSANEKSAAELQLKTIRKL